VIESQREIKGRTTLVQRYYLSSLAPDANRLLRAIRATKRTREPKAPQDRIEESPAFRQG